MPTLTCQKVCNYKLCLKEKKSKNLVSFAAGKRVLPILPVSPSPPVGGRLKKKNTGYCPEKRTIVLPTGCGSSTRCFCGRNKEEFCLSLSLPLSHYRVQLLKSDLCSRQVQQDVWQQQQQQQPQQQCKKGLNFTPCRLHDAGLPGLKS